MSATFEPRSLEELTGLVADAVGAGRTLEVRGAGSKEGFGRPVEAQAVVTTTKLVGIDLYEPQELVMSAGAGTPLAVIERELEERGQELAFEPADYGRISGGPPGTQTIGGVFACNLAGPRRIKAGAARDHILGLQGVTGRGEAIKAGGRVVKNVTGYDLCKLLCGSHGTLAVMSRVTFKVLPRAETEASLVLWGGPEPLLLARLRQAMGSAHELAAAAMLPNLAGGRSALRDVARRGQPQGVLRVEGPAPSVDYRLGSLERELAGDGLEFERLECDASRTLWAEIRDVRLLPAARPLWRVSLPPTAAGELAAWLGGLTPERCYDWAGGLVWLAPRQDEADLSGPLQQALDGRGGNATLVRADVELRRRLPVFTPQPPAVAALTARVKASFDPVRILNPGRMYKDV